MSHWKKIVLSPYFAATTGATALALTLGVANAQNAPLPVVPSIPPTTSTVPASTDAAVLPAPTPANPVPLGTGLPNAASQTLGASLAPNVPAPTANVEALRAQAQALEARLRQLPTNATEQEEQLKIVAELSALKKQIQQAETAAGSFAAFRQAADAERFGVPAPTPENGVAGLGAPASSPVAALPLAPGEAEALRAQKEELTRQYRQLLQTMRALSPSDEALASTLRAEQTTLLNQLKEIDARLANAPQAPTAPTFPNAFPAPAAGLENAIPPENRLASPGLDLIGGNDAAAKIQKANEAAALLREAGLVNLASLAAAEIPRLADPNFVETRFVPGTWTEGAGLAEERYNPFQQISKDEIDAIKTSLDDLKARVDSLTEIMSNVETQLKLLTRQTVAAPSPVVSTPEAPADLVPETPLAE